MAERVKMVLQYRRAGQHLRVLELARALHAEKPLLTAGEWCEVHEAAGLAAWALREHFEAVRWAERAYDVARESDEPCRLAVAAYYRGTYWTIIGDTVQARQYLLEFLARDDPQRPEFDRFRGPAWFNLGSVYLKRLAYDDAAEVLTRACEAFGTVGNSRCEIEAVLQLAWVWTMAGNLPVARDLLKTAAVELAKNSDPDLEASRICHEALLLQRMGQYHDAVQLCEEIFAPGREGITDHHLSEAAWISGECALALGLLQAATIMANLALDHALKANWPTLMNRASDLRRRVMAAGDQPA